MTMSAIDQAMDALIEPWFRSGNSADGHSLKRIRAALRDRLQTVTAQTGAPSSTTP